MSKFSRSNEPGAPPGAGDALQAARVLEAGHRIDEAIDAYGRAGGWSDAARLLSHQGKFRDAGEALLCYLPGEPTPVSQLSATQRRHALNAALCFARGGARKEAVGLLMNLGETQKAASLLSMAGLRNEAVRAMRGEPIPGSPWSPGVLSSLRATSGFQAPSPSQPPWVPPSHGVPTASMHAVPPTGSMPAVGPPSGSMPAVPSSGSTPAVPLREEMARPSLDVRSSSAGFALGEAVVVRNTDSSPPIPPPPLLSPRLAPPAPAGRAPQGIPADTEALLDLAPGDPRLAEAVTRVLRARWRQEPLSPRVVQMLDRYVDAGLRSGCQPTEFATYYAIGRLFEHHDRQGAAKGAFQVAARGGVADAPERLHNLEEGLVQTQYGSWLPVHLVVNGGFHQFASLPELDALAPLGRPFTPAPARPRAQSKPVAREPIPAAPTPRPDSSPSWASSDEFTAPPRNANDETMEIDDYLELEGNSGPHRPPVHVSSGSREDSDSDAPAVQGEADGIAEGSIVANRYRIQSLLGAGGMAAVYKAMDTELEEVVALKVFQQVVQNRQGLERFRREMKLSRKLTHPNIVRIYEFGTWRGARFITMELLVGDDLEKFMKRSGGKLPVAQSISLMMQACDGLGAAHSVGVVHRDVKPQNLFVVDQGKRIKVMDFGIAKATDSATISITGVRVGTPRYMSPEQIQGGGEVGPAADLYALGCVMYEVLTGTPVFLEEELVPLLLNHMTETPEPPSKRNPEVTPDVEAIVLRLLRKSPEERYADCAELKRELLKAYVNAERVSLRR